MTEDILPRPEPLKVNFEHIPQELVRQKQWVLWRYKWKKGIGGKPGKWDKPPYTLKGYYASATDPGTWHSFEEVKTAYLQGQKLPTDNKKHYDGIGFVAKKNSQSDQQLALVDLGKCRNPDSSEIASWAKEDLDLINSYSEVSPSGTGIRIIAKGHQLPNDEKGRKKGHVEIYQSGHYLTITGHRLKGYPATVVVRNVELDSFYKKHFRKTKEKTREKESLTDDEIIQLAESAANADKFKQLMDGETGAYKSQSEADAALCCLIAFYTKDEAQIERIWSKSKLAQREKFERLDYRKRTVQNALETIKEHYRGNGAERWKKTHKNTKKSISSRLVMLAKDNGCELWHTPDGEPHISFTINGHRENHHLKSKAVKRWLGLLLYETEEKAATNASMLEAINVLESEAVHKGPEHPIYIRVGEFNSAIYIDMCDDKWKAIEIKKEEWRVIRQPPIRFTRSKGMLPLPEPIIDGSFEDLKPLLNITADKTWVLIKAILVGVLHPRGPYPIIIFSGEQGSAKSTMQKIIRNLIDPNEAPLRRPPKDKRDLMIAANHSWIVSFDNLSEIRNDLSDALCVLSTGGALSTRELYTDADEIILSARRPVFFNGIDSIPSRHDLLDRAIIINLPSLTEGKRRREREILDEFNQIHPKVLGALCRAVSLGLKNLPTTRPAKLPRMADFATWAVACEEGDWNASLVRSLRHTQGQGKRRFWMLSQQTLWLRQS